MRIVYFGNNPRGVVCLERLLEQSANIVAVVAHPDDKSTDYQGRSVSGVASDNGIPCSKPTKVNSPESVDWLTRFDPDLFILAGYNQIIRSGILGIPGKGVVNLHGGKLPQYRGVAPINWQIINGETTGACSVIFVDEGIDTGDIIAEKEYEIAIGDTAATVLDKTLQIFPDLLVEAVKHIEDDTVTPTPQNHSKGCYYTRRYPRDGEIHWHSQSAYQVHNLVRALVPPYPGAFTHCNNEKVTIWETSLLEQKVRGAPGRIVLRQPGGVVVTAMDEGLLIVTVQPENGSAMTAKEYFKKLGADLY